MNPEDAVIADIDTLLAAGEPRNNPYPRCAGCRHDWHGAKCPCGCPQSDGEVSAHPGRDGMSPAEELWANAFIRLRRLRKTSCPPDTERIGP